jgi:hypothetical protein
MTVSFHILSISIFSVIVKFVIRKEHRLRVFENRLLRRIFGPKRDEVTRESTKLLNEELHNV